MLYLACLIRAREPEDKSGWSDGGRLTATSRKSRRVSLRRREERDRSLFAEFILFNSKRNIVVDEGASYTVLYTEIRVRGGVYSRRIGKTIDSL